MLAQEAGDPRVAACLAALEARPDVAVHRLATTGLSRSRNAALDAAQGEIVLIADDDVTHLPGAHAGIRAFFAENPGVSLLAGQSFTPDGRPRKRFAPRPRRLRRWNAGGISSHELAFRAAPGPRRRHPLRRGLRRGRRNPGVPRRGVHLRRRLPAAQDSRGAYVPLPVSIHPPDSSGFVWDGPAAARARAAVIARVFGPAAAPMRLAFALKNARRFGSLRDLWAFLRG